MPSEASAGFSTPPEDREGQRNHRLESEEPLTLRVYRESSQKLRFELSIPKVGPSEPFPKRFNVSLARRRARELYDLLSESATDTSERVLWKRLAVAGKRLYDEVIPPEVGDELQATARGTALSLELSPKLAWIPWELLSYDEEEFLCTCFQIGRLLHRTPREINTAKKRLGEKQIGGAFIAIGETDQPEKAVEEGEAVEKILKKNGKLAWFYRSLGADSLLEELTKSYDILHFTGHGVYDAKSKGRTGWKCKDGKLLSRKAIDRISSKTAVPLLIFANACVSAHMSLSASEGLITSLYHAFFRKGVPHYIGTLTKVQQAAATEFVNAFYDLLVSGKTIGEALWKARLAFFNRPGTPIWAYYVHYGVPRARVFAETPLAESKPEEVSITTSVADNCAELMADVGRKTENSFAVTVDYDLTLVQMIAAGRYDWKGLSDINAKNFENFPIHGKGKVEVKIELVYLAESMELDKALRELDHQGFRPATLPELLAFGAKYPEKQREFTIAALGSVRRSRRGHLAVPGLYSDGRKRSRRAFGLGAGELFGVGGQDYRFAVVRKQDAMRSRWDDF